LLIVINSWWLNAGCGHRNEATMSHDKIKKAARERMAATGEPYTIARRAVLEEGRFFPISFDTAGLDWITKSLDTLFGGGPGRSGVSVYPAIINGCDNGLVEFGVDPPLRTGRGLSTGFFRQRVDRIAVSLVDPQAFIDAVGSTSG
jgi:hypothetical protein